MPAGTLHTDLLESAYGPIHVVVLRHDAEGARIRKAELLDAQDVLRTYAITFLTYDLSDKELRSIDDEIKNGGSMGKIFRAHSYTMHRKLLDEFNLQLPDWLKKAFRSDRAVAYAKITECWFEKINAKPVQYGTLLEIYHPDFAPEFVMDSQKSAQPALRKKFMSELAEV